MLLVSSCVGLLVGVCLRLEEVNQDQDHPSLLKQSQSHTPQVAKMGSFKSITNGTFAVYNYTGELLYIMEYVRKEDQGDVVFAELGEYHSVDSVVIDIKLIGAPESVLDTQAM